jgi:hypothetical protein
VILGGGERLELAKALGGDAAARNGPGAPTQRALPRTAAPPDGRSGPIVALDRAMALHIEAALERCQGRIEGPDGAALLLEINPHTLRARMRKLGVDWARFRRAGRQGRGQDPR